MSLATVSRHIIRTRRRVIDLFLAIRGYVDPVNLLNYLLQARREKVRQAKQGMKKQLLTGRIRLL
ncbi:MAG: hypothetical protein Kow0037_06420 [Calditrichia bacterium]